MFLHRCRQHGTGGCQLLLRGLAQGRGRLLLSQSLLPGTPREAHSRLFQGVLSAADPFQDIINCLAPSRPHLAFMGALGPHLQTQAPNLSEGALSGELGLTSVSYGSGSHLLSWFPELDYCLCGHTPTLCHHFMNGVPPAQPPLVPLFLLCFFRPREVCP